MDCSSGDLCVLDRTILFLVLCLEHHFLFLLPCFVLQDLSILRLSRRSLDATWIQPACVFLSPLRFSVLLLFPLPSPPIMYRFGRVHNIPWKALKTVKKLKDFKAMMWLKLHELRWAISGLVLQFGQLVTYSLSQTAVCLDLVGKRHCPWVPARWLVSTTCHPPEAQHLSGATVTMFHSLACAHLLIFVGFHKATACLGGLRLFPPSLPLFLFPSTVIEHLLCVLYIWDIKMNKIHLHFH